jgi:HD-GYP domain-containing protein (c-di-GMP phosphodiesterase class II)
VGRELGLEGKELDAVSFAAVFHDIGKLGVRDDVLLKEGPLDEAGWWEMRRHPGEGERIIAHLGFLADSTPAIRHHHERFDGSGYPDGLRGDEIPMSARVLHVADALDAMLSPRVYRPALSLEAALAELTQVSGSQCCPSCVGALNRAIARGTLDDLLAGYRSSVAA